jgi:hypothetical protein
MRIGAPFVFLIALAIGMLLGAELSDWRASAARKADQEESAAAQARLLTALRQKELILDRIGFYVRDDEPMIDSAWRGEQE